MDIDESTSLPIYKAQTRHPILVRFRHCEEWSDDAILSSKEKRG